jgi:hypothetical protein
MREIPEPATWKVDAPSDLALLHPFRRNQEWQ